MGCIRNATPVCESNGAHVGQMEVGICVILNPKKKHMRAFFVCLILRSCDFVYHLKYVQ